MCRRVFRFSPLFFLFSSVASAQLLDFETPAAANDNAVECAARLSNLTYAQGLVLIVHVSRENAVRRARIRRELADDGLIDRETDQIAMTYPRAMVGAGGGIFVLDRVDGRSLFALWSRKPDADIFRWPRDQTFLDRVRKVSPDGRHVILSDAFGSHQQLVHVASGKVMVERSVDHTPRGNTVAIEFSAAGSTVTVRRENLVEVLKLNGDAFTVVGTYDVLPAYYDLDFSDQTGNPADRVTRDGRGEIHHLPHAGAFVAFFDGAAPVLLKLGRTMHAAIVDLGAAPATDFRPTPLPPHLQPSVRAILEHDERPAYLPRGLVAPSERFLVALRAQYREDRLETYVELFDVRTTKFLRRFKIPGAVSALALSPREGRLAVASPDHGGVRVFDLEHAQSAPMTKIDLENFDGRVLAFEGEGRLLVGSEDVARLVRFALPPLATEDR